MVNFTPPETSRAKQRAALLEALKEHSGLTTHDIRAYMQIMHPAGRICELRALGFDIETRVDWFPDNEGQQHHQAQYILRGAV